MIISYFITITTKAISLIIYLYIFFFILNLIFFLISKLWKFICDIFPSYKQKKIEIDWHKHPYTPFDYFKDNERITSFHNFIISHPLFLTIRIITSFFYFFVRPFQYLFGIFWFGFYTFSFIYHLYYKKDIIFINKKKKYLIEYIFIEIPKARAYDILYTILRKIFLKEKENITLEKLSKIFIIFFTSRFFTSSKNITYIDNITIQTYLTLLNENDQIWYNYYNNLIWYKKYFMLFKKTIRDLKTIVKSSECIKNASNQKILYKKNNWIFNPPKLKTLENLKYSDNITSILYTKIKKTYIPHFSLHTEYTSEDFRDECVFTNYPLDSQFFLEMPHNNQKIVINNVSNKKLIKIYDESQPYLKKYVDTNLTLIKKNIEFARMNDNVFISFQDENEIKIFNKNNFYSQILNLKEIKFNNYSKKKAEIILEYKQKHNYLSKEKILWKEENDPLMKEFNKINNDIQLKLAIKFNSFIINIKNDDIK